MGYRVREAKRGMVVDGVVPGVRGLITLVVWTIVLKNPWPWWTFPAAIAVGAGGFIILRILLRQIARMVRIATYLIVIGVLLVLGAGGIMLFTTAFNFLQSATAK